MSEHPNQLVAALTAAMEEAEQVAGTSGADKKQYVLEAVSAIANRTLGVDDASLVGAIAPAIIDALIAASKGVMRVNENGQPAEGCCSIL